MIRAVLFDIGSTLWSSPAEDPDGLKLVYGRGRDHLIDAGLEVPSVDSLIPAVEEYLGEWEEIWRTDPTQVTQRPTTAFVAEALARINIAAPDDFLSRFTNEVMEASVYTAKVEPHEPGMREALQELQSMGLRLACVSNAFMGAATLGRIMDERGLSPHLEFIISSCEAGIRKPHPEIYRVAAERIGLSPEEVIYVGDRVDADVEGPSAIGMRGVLTHQYRQEDPAKGKVAPHAVIRHLSELPDALRSLI